VGRPNAKLVEALNSQPPKSVRVEIRYNMDYGYRSDSMYGPTSCAAFAIDFNWDADVPIRRLEGQYPKMRESGGYYACDFLLSDLPLNRKITITASMGSDPTAAWNKGSQAQPPAGSHRAILDGTRSVTLTDSAPRASLSFEMIYEQPRSVERPRFKVPLKP
jgi:hypothetical protein